MIFVPLRYGGKALLSMRCSVNSKMILSICLRAGEIMLKSGAETYRIEDTMTRILEAAHCKNVEAFVTTTGIFAGYEDELTGPVSMLRRVKNRTYHMKKVALVNDLSRRLSIGAIDLNQMLRLLNDIDALPPNPVKLRMLSSGVACMAFCFMFGGVLSDCLCALLIGFMTCLFMHLLTSAKMPAFLINLFSGALISTCALAFAYFMPGVNLDTIVIGAIMPLVPGIALTNAARDILEGDYLSGTTRMMDAIVTALAIATGVGLSLGLGQLPVTAIENVVRSPFLRVMEVPAAFAATFCFALLFSVPEKELLPAGLTGACCWLVYLIFCQFGQYSLAVLFGTMVVTAISWFLAVKRKMPLTVYLVMGIIPLVPGSGIYNTMYDIVTYQNLSAIAKGIETCKIAGIIAIGIIVVLSLQKSLKR